jgi:hypothetical protein
MFETGLTLLVIQRELNNLAALGIVNIERTRNRVYYEINSKSPLFRPLAEICRGFQGEHFPGFDGKQS